MTLYLHLGFPAMAESESRTVQWEGHLQTSKIGAFCVLMNVDASHESHEMKYGKATNNTISLNRFLFATTFDCKVPHLLKVDSVGIHQPNQSIKTYFIHPPKNTVPNMGSSHVPTANSK